MIPTTKYYYHDEEINVKEITLDTKIANLLNDYDNMKDILVSINKKFKKLNNPVLRRTIAKVASVRQAAVVGGMDPLDLLNQLREAVGQGSVSIEKEATNNDTVDIPEWITIEAKDTIDAEKLLEEEKNPLAVTHNVLRKLHSGDIVTLTSSFRPEPLIDEFIKAGHELYCQEISKDSYITYIKRK